MAIKLQRASKLRNKQVDINESVKSQDHDSLSQDEQIDIESDPKSSYNMHSRRTGPIITNIQFVATYIQLRTHLHYGNPANLGKKLNITYSDILTSLQLWRGKVNRSKYWGCEYVSQRKDVPRPYRGTYWDRRNGSYYLLYTGKQHSVAFSSNITTLKDLFNCRHKNGNKNGNK